ncbi:MAG: hypothetical protein OJF51_005035 [Nitrospira sp.]|nr:MAG: hypothetical protein OJF51_005035 [Nitrospira sp.]
MGGSLKWIENYGRGISTAKNYFTKPSFIDVWEHLSISSYPTISQITL